MLHNPEMTFVKTSIKEMTELGRIIAQKLNRSHGNTLVMIPLRGFSYPNCKGRIFYNPEGVKAFVRTLKEKIDRNIPVKELPFHINDQEFAVSVVAEFKKIDREHYTQSHFVKDGESPGLSS